MGKYLVESYEQALRENAALREENERLTAANKARAEYLTTRRAGNDVDSYVNLAETKIEELRAQLAEAQEELAQWRATGESVTRNEYVLSARLAEVEARHQRVMAVIRLFCAKYAPYLLAEFDAAVTDSAAHREDESHD